MLVIIAIVGAVGTVLGICAIAGCILSSQNSRRLEKHNSEQPQLPMASGF